MPVGDARLLPLVDLEGEVRSPELADDVGVRRDKPGDVELEAVDPLEHGQTLELVVDAAE